MNKEEFTDRVQLIGGLLKEDLEEFFTSNVVIPKGKNRHPYADVLHEWIEDITKELQEKHKSEIVGCGYLWKDKDISLGEIRIKPSEPVYEYKVCMHFHDGSFEHTDRYFTVNEFREFGFPKCCLLDDTTKRIRQ